jgi:hypothetical protein
MPYLWLTPKVRNENNPIQTVDRDQRWMNETFSSGYLQDRSYHGSLIMYLGHSCLNGNWNDGYQFYQLLRRRAKTASQISNFF